MIRFSFDRPERDQWAIGLVSWKEGPNERHVYVCLLLVALVIKIQRQPA